MVITSLISYMFTLPSPWQLRSSCDDRLFCGPHVRTKSYGQGSFAYQGANTWNQLPLSVWHSQSLASFKTKLEPHLFPKWKDFEAECTTALSIISFFSPVYTTLFAVRSAWLQRVAALCVQQVLRVWECVCVRACAWVSDCRVCVSVCVCVFKLAEQ